MNLAIDHVRRRPAWSCRSLVVTRKGWPHRSTLAPSENDSDDHQHDAHRTGHRESLDDRAEPADVIDDDRGDDLPGHDETDRVADAEPRREKRDGYHVACNNESTKVAVGWHVPQCLQRWKRYAYDDRPGCYGNE